MIQCALTGGIGAGKSLVCEIFSLLGAAIFNADEAAKSLYKRPEVVASVRKEFGPACVNEGKVDFKALAELVFDHAEALKKLNGLIHPLLMDEYRTWIQQQPPEKICIMEAAIIFEAGLEKNFDHIICVYAPESLCLERIIKRDRVVEDKARARMNAQMDPEIKVKRSDFVVINDDRQLVIPQVVDIYKTLMEVHS